MRRLGLRVQIVVSLAFFLVLSVFNLGFVTLGLAQRTVLAQGEETSRVVARALQAELRLARSDGDRLSRVARAALGTAGVDEIIVWDEHRRVRLHVSLPDRHDGLRGIDPRSLQPREELVEDESGPRLVSFRVFTDPDGAAAVNVSLQDALRSLGTLRGLTLLYACVSAFVLLVFGYVGLTRLIVRPVTALRHAAERVAAGVLDTRVPVTGSNEVAELAESFNRMTSQLRGQRVELTQKLQELQQKTADLQAVQEHLVRSAKLASVGQLAAGVAHEIGNPVSAIMGFCDILASGDVPAEEARDFVIRMRKEAERMNRIIRDLLDYARPSPDADDPETGCDLAGVIEDSTSLLGPQRTFREVDVERVLPAELPIVRGSRERLTQVLVNLLINSADAMGGKGLVRVGAELVRDWRGPDGKVTPRAVRIRVADSGPGIAPDHLARIFDPFFTTKEPGHGTGLGLAVCQGLVAAMGGAIRADNDPAGGAVFTIELPCVEQ